MLGYTLSLDLLHSIEVDSINYWPKKNIKGAQHIEIESDNYIRVTYVRSNTASTAPKLHQPAILYEPTCHTQAHSLTISQGTN